MVFRVFGLAILGGRKYLKDVYIRNVELRMYKADGSYEHHEHHEHHNDTGSLISIDVMLSSGDNFQGGKFCTCTPFIPPSLPPHATQFLA